MILVMEQTIIYIVLILSGLCLGSFAGASIWRIRARQLKQDKINGEKINPDEYKSLNKLNNSKLLNDHSRCLNCSYNLKWYDLIPLISWLLLAGKCRKCRQPIGYMEPLIELGVAGFFILSYIFWPYPLNNGLEITRLILWLISGIGLAILFVYDKKWFLLPQSISNLTIIIGLFSSTLFIFGASDKLDAVYGIIGSVAILGGLYWVLDKASNGKWVGSGDARLGLGLALLLADWKLAFITLFMANLIGCIIVLPAMTIGKLNLKSHIPFGPLLIVGTIIAMLIGNYLINIFLYGLG